MREIRPGVYGPLEFELNMFGHRRLVKLVKDGSDMCRFIIKCKGLSSTVLYHLETINNFSR